jgi:phosphohistidine phosphatase
LVRHAKSDWNDPSLKDFDRPLNDRGKRDAPVMVQRLLDKKITIDQFITSTAKRARKTAETFAKAYKADDGVVYFDELYLAGPAELADVIARTDKKQNIIAVFSHNPGITEYANMLADVQIDNIPTCGIFAVKADVKSWRDFEAAPKEFWFFDYPKAGSD